MYNKVDTNMNFVEREKKTEQFWRENNIFRKSMENRKEGETYTFYDGPPTANGKPHIGHVETRTIKDMIPRFQTMKGKYVPRKQAGIHTDFLLRSRWRSFSALTARIRLRTTDLSHSSRNVKSLYGNTRVCGRISPTQ